MSVSLLLFWVTLAFLLLAPLVVLYSSVAALVCPTHHRGGAFWVALSNRGWGEVFMAYRFTPDTREFCLFLFAVAAASIPAAFKRASDSSHGLCQGAVCDNAYTHWKKKNILKYILNQKRFQWEQKKCPHVCTQLFKESLKYITTPLKPYVAGVE